jgi:phytoene synthase
VDLTPGAHAPAADDVGQAAEAVRAPADFHYASLYLPPMQRATACALEAVRRAVTGVPAQCSDRGVAHLKLAWWEEEFARLASGAARHPLSTALPRAGAAPPTLVAGLGTRLVHATIAELQDLRLPTRDAVLDHVAGIHGECWGLLFDADADAGADRTAHLTVNAVRLASLVELAYELRGLRQHRRGGTLYLAADVLATHGLSPSRVREAHRTAELGTLVADELGWLREALAAALGALAAQERRRYRVLVTLARCTLGALAMTVADGCQVLERRIELLPVHKLWLAWRSHRLPGWR